VINHGIDTARAALAGRLLSELSIESTMPKPLEIIEL
jgi:hypothetical protein